MKKQRLAAISIIVIFALLSAAGCETYDNFVNAFFADDDDSGTIVRIGVFQPLSGIHEEYGELEKLGIELAHEFYPRALRKEVELIFADNKSDIHIAEIAIQNLISRNPSIVIGSYGGLYSLIAAGYLEEAQIPAIAVTNTNWLVTKNNPFYFRVCFVYSYEGIALAKFAAEEMQVRSAAILRPINDDAAIAVTQAFRDKMIQLTGNANIIISDQDFDPYALDFSEQLAIIRTSRAEVVFLPANIDNAAEILKQAKQLNLNTVFLGTEKWESQDFINKAGEAAEGVAFSTLFDPDSGITEMTEVFLNAYKAKFGEDSVPHSAIALGFDAYLLAIDSINRAGTSTDGEKIALALAQTRQFPGASGSITFDEHGDPIKSVVIKTIQNGEAVAIHTVEPAWVDLSEEEEEEEQYNAN